MNDVNHFLSQYVQQNAVQKILILSDQKVNDLFPDYFTFFSDDVDVHWIKLTCDEKIKDIATVLEIWNFLLSHQFDRNSLLINWGGGVICDLGGFIAATYKRGIRLVNIPTTLLAMIDAAHGGKNGINLQHYKNTIGTFYLPDEVLIDATFLNTLPQEEVLNGFAELIKYALIADAELWEQLKKMQHLSANQIPQLWLEKAANFKKELTKKDLFDKNERQLLNFGHTIGHAIETFMQMKNKPVAHGFAVVQGICCEAYISHLHQFITLQQVNEICDFIKKQYELPLFCEEEVSHIAKNCMQDKKNLNDDIRMVLLKEVGEGIVKQSVTLFLISQSLSKCFLSHPHRDIQ
ncbi:MAG: 3-dehydroquinate synthase [Lentimicrobiaceae bacterium]|nr:3-dehydroquinate synthase [Lentimicrobiaceae bacterium]